jgi:hypothetical protein
MSLRAFHIFFISVVTLFCFGIGAAVFALGFDPRLGVVLAGFGVVIALYGMWFIRKTRKLIL